MMRDKFSTWKWKICSLHGVLGDDFKYFAEKYVLICLPAVVLCVSGELKSTKANRHRDRKNGHTRCTRMNPPLMQKCSREMVLQGQNQSPAEGIETSWEKFQGPRTGKGCVDVSQADD